MKRSQTIKIQDPDYGDTYTLHIQQNESGWIGWVQEHPKVRCKDQTKEALLKTLQTTLFEKLEADWETWDKQLEEDVKAGKLEHLSEQALENFKAGRYYKIEDLQKLLEK